MQPLYLGSHICSWLCLEGVRSADKAAGSPSGLVGQRWGRALRPSSAPAVGLNQDPEGRGGRLWVVQLLLGVFRVVRLWREVETEPLPTKPALCGGGEV